MLRLVGVAALGALAACGSVSAQKLPVFGEQLYVKAVMQLPYAGIIEPIESYYDGKSGNMRVDYYGGLDTYIFRTDLNVTWQVNPVSMDGLPSTRCFATAGPPNIRSFLPDLTGFELQTDATQVNQQICDNWQLQVNTLGKVSTYNFFVSRTTGQAVRYQMMGYDSLIGSHFDLYQLDYTNLTNVASFPAGIFDQPSGKQCGSFPGPGATHMNPLDEMDGYFPGDIEEEELLSPEYKDYLAAHGKTAAADGKEVRLREIQFKKHSHFIAAHQRQVRMGKASYSVGLNFLADHLPAELNARRGKLPSGMGGRKTNDAAEYHQRQFSDADLPTSIDWREKGAVNPPQDQGICGSCWSFGSTAAIESAYFLKYGKLKVFAEQELMDCSWGEGNNACDGGEDFRAYNWIMKNGGISFKENYGPYLMADGYCSAGVLIPDASIHHYVNVTQQDEVALMDAIASQGPLSVSIDASHPGLSFYTGGVYDDPACGNQPDDLDHSVSAVGYGTEDGQDYWIVKNNWSTYWGLDGYIKMARKNNNCGVATMPTYVVLN